MCCTLQTHVKVIAILCLLGTGSSIKAIINWLMLVPSLLAIESSGVKAFAIIFTLITIVNYLAWFVSEVLLFIGALKRKKIFLVPFIICICANILLFTILGLCVIIMGGKLMELINEVQATSETTVYSKEWNIGNPPNTGVENADEFGGLLIATILTPLILYIAILTYPLVIVVKFYKEISAEENSGQQGGIVLEPLTAEEGYTPAVNVYVPPGSEKVPCA